MRKLLTWILVTVGIAALVRKLRSRGEAGPPEPPVAADPADELRQKLASSREPAAPGETAGEAAGQDTTPSDDPPPPPPPPASEPSIDEQRAEVHGEGRAAIHEMQKSAED